MNQKTKLSASSKKIVDLIATVTGGSQREFARLVGCSQPVISRVVNGKQEPGRDLLERIAKLESVDRDELFATLKSKAAMSRIAETMVPIAKCLLDGSPAARRDQLTGSTVSLSPAIFRESLYAVPARECRPAFHDPSEWMQPDDLVIIESSTERLQKNIPGVHGRLCVVVLRDPNGNAILLTRVFVDFDANVQRSSIRIKSQKPAAAPSKFKGRAIDLDGDSRVVPTPTSEWQFVEIEDIAGLAIELVRNL